MANTIPSASVFYDGDGSTTQYPVTFEYLDKAYVFATVDGADAAFTWATDNTIEFTTAPAAGTQNVNIYRTTAADAMLAVFSEDTPFLPKYVDKDYTQLLHLIQEANSGSVDRDNTEEAARIAADAVLTASITAEAAARAAADAKEAAARAAGDAYLQQQINGATPTVTPYITSFAALRLLRPVLEGQLAYLSGYYSGSSAGGGMFRAVNASGTDNGGTVAVYSSSWYWERVLEAAEVTLEMFGALGTGETTTLDADALYAAVAALKDSSGVLSGTIRGDASRAYYFDRSINIDAGQAPYGTQTTAQRAARLRLCLDGAVTFAGGIGDGIYLTNAHMAFVSLNVCNGGSDVDTDSALRLGITRGGEFDIKGRGFAGTLFKYSGGSTDRVQEINDVRIHGIQCGRCISFVGSTSGIGLFSRVWNVLPTTSDVFNGVADVTLADYEATVASSFTESILQIIGGSSYHIGKIALGEGSQSNGQLYIRSCSHVMIDRCFFWGGLAADRADIGLWAIASRVQIGEFRSGYMGLGLLVDGASVVTVDQTFCRDNLVDIKVAPVYSSNTSMELQVRSHISTGAYAESVIVDSAVTGGRLQIQGGSLQAGNVAGTSAYALNLAGSSTFRIFLDNLYVSGSYSTASLYATTMNLVHCGGNCVFTQGVRSGSSITGVSSDGMSYMIALSATPSFATAYTNAYYKPIQVYQPITTTDAAGYATLTLTDTQGGTHVVDRVGGAAGTYYLKGLVPPGWSYTFTQSSTTTVTMAAGGKRQAV